MGIFIQVDFDSSQIPPETAQRLVQLCPVDIFRLNDNVVSIQPEQEDECTLCGLCLKAAPAGALTIYKVYKDERLISSGAKS
ncbi:MAG: hypothetical protein U0401_20045 [Anaerolineae bacterium]